MEEMSVILYPCAIVSGCAAAHRCSRAFCIARIRLRPDRHWRHRGLSSRSERRGGPEGYHHGHQRQRHTKCSHTVSNSSGQYQFTGLRVGEYTVKATATGFGTQVVSDVQIDVQSRPSIDFTLKIGDASQTVQVESAAPLLNTQTADVGGVVQEQQIRDLPLNGRRYADLALLEAGIQKDPTVSNAAADRFSSNGNLETQNYFSLDGIENNSGSTNLQEGSVQTVQPPPDALSEFRVQTRTYSAEFGTSAGAVINASIKSGSDAFHGDVWEFRAQQRFDSNTFLNNAGGVPRGHFSQNQFGGTIGGPIIKHKTFFFGDAQDLKKPQSDHDSLHRSHTSDEDRQLHGA